MCRLIIAPSDMKKEKKNTGPYNHSYPKRQPLTTNFKWNQCIPTKLIQGKQLPCILPQKQKLSRKRAITTKILWMITNIELDLYFTMIYPSANFQYNQFFFFFFLFDLGFTALSRIFHLYRADRSSKVGENRSTRRKTTWPSVSRTWLSHIWPELGSNHSGEKPNGLRVNSLIH